MDCNSSDCFPMSHDKGCRASIKRHWVKFVTSLPVVKVQKASRVPCHVSHPTDLSQQGRCLVIDAMTCLESLPMTPPRIEATAYVPRDTDGLITTAVCSCA